MKPGKDVCRDTNYQNNRNHMAYMLFRLTSTHKERECWALILSCYITGWNNIRLQIWDRVESLRGLQ